MDILAFVFARMLTKAFWLMVAVTFVAVLMAAARANFKDAIYQAAMNTVGKRFGP